MLWPGVGNIYNGQVLFGLFLMGLFPISFLATILFYGFITTPLLWIFGLFSAYLGARIRNRKRKRLQARALPGWWPSLSVFVSSRFGVVVFVSLATMTLVLDSPCETRRNGSRVYTHLGRPANAETGLNDLELAQLHWLLNKALQPVNQWDGFESVDQFGQTALRYQIAFLFYAIAHAHYHRTPAYRDIYQEALDRLIQRMLEKRVWEYWYYENLLGNWNANPDPVASKNVMYSGHLANMISLYEMLFNDRKYDRPGAITFVWDRRTEFAYDHATLEQVLHRQMRDNPWHSIACEPHQVFSMCNDHAVLSLLLFDHTHRTHLAAVIEEYKRVIPKLFLTDRGHFHYPYYYELGATLPLHLALGDAWTLAFMNPFYPELVRQLYPAFVQRHVKEFADGSATLSGKIYEWMDLGNYRLNDASPVAFGLILANEMGQEALASKLWQRAGRCYEPRWEEGRLYFHRVSLLVNALLFLGRLNVKDGLWALYNRPWDARHFSEPYLTRVDYPGVLVKQAYYDAAMGRLVFTVVPGESGEVMTRFEVRNLDPRRRYVLVKNGVVVGRGWRPSGPTPRLEWTGAVRGEERWLVEAMSGSDSSKGAGS